MPKKKAEGLTEEVMKTSIQEMAEGLGMPPIKFNPDGYLLNYWRGRPLKLSELEKMPDGSIVYATYKEHGEEGYRINGAMRISREGSDRRWFLEDGSSFASEFNAAHDDADGECFDNGCGEGEMYLFHVEKITTAERKARLSALSKLTKACEDIIAGGPAAKRALASLKPKKSRGRQ
jgi:hypothetical protein